MNLQLRVGNRSLDQLRRHERYIKASNRRRGRDLGATGKMKARDLKKTWDREYFTVVDAGNGEVAFHNPRFNRFIRMASKTNMDMSGDRATLPAGWKSERFTPVNAGNGQIALYCRAHRRFVQMRPDGSMKTKGGGNGDRDLNVDDLSPTWTYERFTVVQGHPYFYLEPGSVVAFRCNKHHRFMRMNGGDMSRSDIHGAYKPSSRRSYTYFKVVDAGGGLIALHSAKYNRFVAMLSNGKMRATRRDLGNSLSFLACPYHKTRGAANTTTLWANRSELMLSRGRGNSDSSNFPIRSVQDLPGQRYKVCARAARRLDEPAVRGGAGRERADCFAQPLEGPLHLHVEQCHWVELGIDSCFLECKLTLKACRDSQSMLLMRASSISEGHGGKWEQESTGLARPLELGAIQGLAVLSLLQPTRGDEG